jgi:hypothetical protein
VNAANPLADIDPRLMTEAFRRVRERRECDEIDSDALLSAIFAAARRGARDLYSLVKAAEAARMGGAA